LEDEVGKKLDLDALLGEEALELTLAGETWTIEDAPIALLMRIQKAAENGERIDALQVIEETLKPLGWKKEHSEKIGTKGAILASAAISRHFTECPDALEQAYPGAKALLETARETVASTGQEPSATS
jgi:hypothetical protein